MARLVIRVLGPFEVTLDGEPVNGFETRKARALLAYLAAEGNRPHRREALAEMLWPGRPEGAARANLRHSLRALRLAIGDYKASPPYLLLTPHTIQFNNSSDVWIDVAAFAALLPANRLTALPTNQQTVRELEEAGQLFRGPFLEDVSLADSAAFEEWLVLRREQYSHQLLNALCRLAGYHEQRGEYEPALGYALRRVELEPWDETAQRQTMRLLAVTGRRAEALGQYKAFQRVLAEELNVEPVTETTRLYEQIRDNEVELLHMAPSFLGEPVAPLHLPGFIESETDAVELPVFVARERELEWLDIFLAEALVGHGRVLFVTGGPGRGKTALLTEFGRRAMEVHPDLLVASGNCNAYSGVGDPYLPFRDVLAMLTGDVEARWLAGALTTDQARRLWNTLPVAIQALLQHGPDVLGTLVPGQALLARAATWCASDASALHGAPWLQPLRGRVARRQADSTGTQQSHLFQQVTNLLRDLAETHPLLLILDDLQWADIASIGLLFHLGRRLEGAHILVAGAYRAEEIALGRAEERHPLLKVLSEFKRIHGDVWLDLAEDEEPERRRFVDAFLETESNRLGEDFRRALTEHTGGHPLFTVELLRAMQARGDLERDEAGRWIEGPVLDWETVPTRVEGVIEERVSRLEPELREILRVASVEGEAFTAQVVAQVQGMEERPLLRLLTEELGRRHRLVAEQAEAQIGEERLCRFKFGHVLVQNYVYRQLSQRERRLLHREVAVALESWCRDQVDDFAVQLAHHYDRAGDDGPALSYFARAAENARRVYANDEAITHYTRAIEVAERVSLDAVSLAKLYRGRGLAFERLGEFDRARADHEVILQIARAAGGRRVEWRALLDLGRLWASRDYSNAHVCFRDALALAQRMGEPKVLAESLNWMGNWYLNQENPRAAIEYHGEALEIFEQVGDRRGLATTLDLLGIASLLGSDIAASVGHYDRAITLFREVDDRPRLCSSLTGRGHAGGTTYTALTVVSPVVPISPRRDFDEAIRIARETGSPAGEAWVAWSLGRLHMVHGRYGQALDVIQRGLDIATRIGHREWIVGNQCALGVLYLELLRPEETRLQLELALSLAEELRSQYWIHHATGGLAAAYCRLDDLTKARRLLESVLSDETPMDSLTKRYCWARLAELALRQGDPMLALDIIERLIVSAPGISPGRVITFLWKLHGESLSAMGRLDEACSLLRAALDNALVTGERFLLWRIHASLGRLYGAMDRQSEAAKEFATARELIEELADAVPTGELRDVFLQRAHARLGVSP